MRRIYLVLGVAIIALGLVHAAATLFLFDELNSRAVWFASSGVAIILAGLLNLLNGAYGADAAGVRWASIFANATMTVLAIVAGYADAAPTAQIGAIAGLMALTLILSLRPPGGRPASG